MIKEINNMWRTITMDELYGYINKDQDTFIKPTFPTRRWGNVYTKDSTTNIKDINDILKRLKEDGYTVRKRIDKKNNTGVFYRIDIKDNTSILN